MENRKIKSRCMFFNDDRILLCHNFEYDYYFFPGGSGNEGESAEETLVREILEEFGTSLENIQFLTTIKNVGRGLDETITMFRADFANKDLYRKSGLPLIDLPEMKAVWVPLNGIREGKVRVLPEYDYISLLEKQF